MKKLIKLFIVMVVLCTTACTQIFDNRNDIDQMKNVGRLVMKVEKNSRSINPTFQESDIKSAVLTANGNEIKSWSGDNIINQIENTDDILLDVGNYDFTMTFSNANGTDILTATTNQEIVPGDNTLHFDMKLITTGNGTGDISIILTWDVASGINKITAGLYDISTDEPLADFGDSELKITISDDETQTPTATYSPSGVPVGQYIIKFKVYNIPNNQDEKLLNTLSEVINVAAGITTSTQITLSKINTQYTITYILSGGNWADGFTATEDRNANAKIILPTADDIIREGYEFGGWYDDNNNWITEIPSDTAQNISVTAKWYNAICEASNVSDKISKLTGDGPYDVAVRGAITSDTISQINTALSKLTANVNLDLSETTGLESIGDSAFKGRENLISILLPDSITTIGNYAFQRCTNLGSIIMPDSITTIGNYVFQSCYSLADITFSNRLDSIGTSAFSYCTSLTEVIIPNSVTTIDYSAFSGCTSLQTVTIGSGVTSIDNSAFDSCSALTSVTFAEDSQLTAINRSAFYFTGLTDITIPASVTTIGESAFYGCSALTSVTFAEDSQLTAIGESAFHSTGLTEITIPDSVTTIDYYAFYGCSSLTEIDIPDSVKTIESYAFYDCNAVKTLVTGNGLKSLDNLPITSALEFITIGDSITDIGDAFSGCTSLTFSVGPTNTMYSTSDDGKILFNKDKTEIISYPSATGEITIPDSVITIGAVAFSGCNEITTVTTGNGLTSLDNLPITSALEFITIGDSITNIGDAFSGCASLTFSVGPTNTMYSTSDDGNILFNNDQTEIISYPSATGDITISDDVTSIGADAFSGCLELTSVTIGRGVTSIGESAFVGCTSLNFIVDSANTMYSTSDDGKILFNNDQTEIISYPSATGEITIPDSVKTISASAFYGCNSVTTLEIGNGLTSLDYLPITSALESITIGDSITEIGAGKFRDFTALRSVTIGSGVKSIGDTAFYQCSSLISVEFSKNSQLIAIGVNAFFGCTKLTSVTFSETQLTEIGQQAFYGCSSLTSITIPDSVTTIGKHAFNSCSALTSVTFAAPDNWYYADDENYTNATQMDVATPGTNAIKLTGDYSEKYWYRQTN